MTEMLKIGFVGTGIMGKSMLCNLGKKGYEMHAYARQLSMEMTLPLRLALRISTRFALVS